VSSLPQSLRRIRDGNSGLVVGKFYTPDELKTNGFQLKELVLDGIVEPESIPKDETFLVYEIKKNGQVVGWLWKEVFLDREKLQRRYELFVEAHARMDNILEENKLDDDILKKVEEVRHKMHLWAILLKRTQWKENLYSYDASELKAKVEIDILNKNMQLNKAANFIADNKDFGWAAIKDKMVELSYGLGHLRDYPYGTGDGDDSYADIGILYIYKAINEYWKNEGYNIVLFTAPEKLIERHFHVDSRGIYEYFIQIPTLRFNAELMNLIMHQVSHLSKYLDKITLDEAWNQDIFHNLIGLLKEVDWSKYIKEGRTLQLYSEMNSWGAKGYYQTELKNMGIPVPDFRIMKWDEKLSPQGLFPQNTAVYSVRSSPPFPMPGLVDTVLNVGMTEEKVELLARKYGERFVYETYARFLRSFGMSVFRIEKELFGDIPSSLNSQTAQELAQKYKKIIEGKGFKIPQDQLQQLEMAMKAVKDSWNSEAAKKYRLDNGIPDALGTAVMIQDMKFGNLNEKSGSFVLISRDDISGEKRILIEYVPQRQGDDLMTGAINPIPIEQSSLAPQIINEIKSYAEGIEREFKDMQVIEGVIEDGKVWILQRGDFKRSPEATVKIAVEMVNAALLTKEELFMKINLKQLKEDLTHVQIDPKIKTTPIGRGEGVYTGASSGAIALSLDKLKELEDKGIPAIWIKEEAYPDDYNGMVLAEGLVVRLGGRLKHAAILGRTLKKPTIVGATSLKIDRQNKTVTIGGKTYKEGDFITIDGTSGDIYDGMLNLIKINPQDNSYFITLAQWYKEIYGRDI